MITFFSGWQWSFSRCLLIVIEESYISYTRSYFCSAQEVNSRLCIWKTCITPKFIHFTLMSEKMWGYATAAESTLKAKLHFCVYFGEFSKNFFGGYLQQLVLTIYKTSFCFFNIWFYVIVNNSFTIFEAQMQFFFFLDWLACTKLHKDHKQALTIAPNEMRSSS